ncbi:S26 family signal peptidase, partial [Klebsiella pneumoniae]|uniref:S26 family signal peptidase n=1 Tax=Klebsiella pneumoniae TaxID=573 RepID=UPI003854F2F3
KRCVAMPGDTLQVKNAELYINGKPAYVAPGAQTEYIAVTNGTNFTDEFLKDELGIDPVESDGQFGPGLEKNSFVLNMTADEAAKV